MINKTNWMQKVHSIAFIIFIVVIHVFSIDLTFKLDKTVILEKFIDKRIKLPNESKYKT